MNEIKAKVGYHFFFPAKISEKNLLKLNDGKFTNSPILDDITETENFLFGDNIKFPHKRYIIAKPEMSLEGFKFTDANIMLTYFEDTGVVSASLNTSFYTSNIESMIYMRQIFLSAIPVTGTKKSISDIVSEAISEFDLELSCAQIAYIAEINEFFNIENIPDIFENNANSIYGMMTGDEGYEYVSPESAVQRLQNCWSTREFVRAAVFHNNFILFNINNNKRANKYYEHQTKFGSEYYGSPNPYFFIDSADAGVNHGLMFSVELGMVAKTISSWVLERQISNSKRRKNLVGREIKRAKAMRRDLILTLNRLETTGIAEMNELDKLVIDSLDVNPLIEKIKYLLELLESELDLLYQTKTNTLINILTIAGVIIAAAQLIAQFIM